MCILPVALRYVFQLNLIMAWEISDLALGIVFPGTRLDWGDVPILQIIKDIKTRIADDQVIVRNGPRQIFSDTTDLVAISL